MGIGIDGNHQYGNGSWALTEASKDLVEVNIEKWFSKPQEETSFAFFGAWRFEIYEDESRASQSLRFLIISLNTMCWGRPTCSKTSRRTYKHHSAADRVFNDTVL